MMEEPRLIEGGLAVDDRGTVSFINDFDFNPKRLYIVNNWESGFVRAWHGHKHESKCVMVISGSAIAAVTKVDNWENPSKTSTVHRFVLTDVKPCVLYIPAGYANGLKTLTDTCSVVYFSDKTLGESTGDDWRFPWDYWGKKMWKVERR